jgi:hypothetical protein
LNVGAVQSDLGLDGIKSSAKDMKSRFENYNDSHIDDGKGKVKLLSFFFFSINKQICSNYLQFQEELQQLKERSEVSGQKSKWENPVSLKFAWIELETNWLFYWQ